MINCLIVDDEPVARAIIRKYCNHLSQLHITAECSNAFEAKEALLAYKIDLMFVDINMPVLNGVGFLGTLRNAPLVIFTTAYQQYAVSAFDLAACDYLLKTILSRTLHGSHRQGTGKTAIGGRGYV